MNQIISNTSSIPTKPYNKRVPEIIADQFRSIYEDAGYKASELEQMIIENTFFITKRFDNPDVTRQRNDHAAKLNWFYRFHKKIVSVGLGQNNRKRKLPYQPLCYAFLDYPGSRHEPSRPTQSGSVSGQGLYDQTRNPGGLVGVDKIGGIHIHAPIVIKPHYGQSCRDVLLEWQSASSNYSNPDLKIEQFDPDRCTLERAIAYCAKGHERLAQASGQLTWDMFGSG